MASEIFSPQGGLLPDWGAAADWSGLVVPGAGTAALINVAYVLVDPLTTLAADITLEGGAALEGNGAGFVITGLLRSTDSDALYADGAIANDGTIEIAAGSLRVVVEAGSAIAASYGLSVPSFLNAGGVLVAGGATLNIDGTEFSNIGTVEVAGVMNVSGGWVDGGQGALPPGGVIEIGAGGLAAFNEGVTDQSFVFDGRGTISFGDPNDVSGDVVNGFGAGDEILTGSAAAARGLLGDLTFGALPAGESLAIKTFAGGAAIIAEHDDDPPCFARGTRILTPAGYAPVEAITPGDLVITAAGAARPVRWVGWRTLDLAAMRRPEAYFPVRVKAGALSPRVPARDVLLSPDHALLLDGWLVPVKLLVNGVTILRDRRPAVTYFHLELDRHDMVIAEGMAAETYLDTGNRGRFATAAGKAAGPPAFGRGRQWDARAYAHLCVAGPGLRAIRQALFDRVAGLGYRHRILREVDLLVDGAAIQRSFGPVALPCFQLPEGHGGRVTIRSASFVPAEMAAAEEDDWRRLGVCLRRVKLGSKSVPAGAVAVSGFHPRGAHDVADWTDGNGVIEVPRTATDIALNISALPKGWLRPASVVTD